MNISPVISLLVVLGFSLCATFVLWRIYRQRRDAKTWLVIKIVGNLIFVVTIASFFFLDLNVEVTILGLAIVLCLWGVATSRAVKVAKSDIGKP